MSAETFLGGKVSLHCGDCREVLATLNDMSIDSVVTDPPYALVSITKRFGSDTAAPAKGGVYARAAAGFMGKQWDNGATAFDSAFWREVLRVLKPGGHVIAASGTRTYHRLAVAIEDAGFEIRDMVLWLYGSGFPKSHDVSKGIDRIANAERNVVGSKLGLPGYHLNAHDGGEAFGEGLSSSTYETRLKSSQITAPATPEAAAWQGYGTALKPACEPWVLARKPLVGTVAANVLAHGTGALNINGCRILAPDGLTSSGNKSSSPLHMDRQADINRVTQRAEGNPLGRWPANVIHDGSDEVVGAFPETGAASDRLRNNGEFKSVAKGREAPHITFGHADSGGSAARFFYSAKADATDRIGSKHPTVKPIDLMQYLCRLITPPGGTVLDPFAGTGTTGEAAWREGFNAVLIEREADYQADIRRRMVLATAGPIERQHAITKAKGKAAADGPLFAWASEAAE